MAYGAYLAIMVGISVYFFVVTLSNIVYLRRATARARDTTGPLVSVIVPARDEERSIARCVNSLLAQDYTNYEVLVVDDESSDATGAIVSDAAMRDDRLKLVPSAPLPDGWIGKPHALSRGVAASSGEILVLTDADTVHEPSSISWAVTNLRVHDADLLSGYLRQEYGSLGEAITVPILYAMMMLVPLSLVPRKTHPRIAFSIGQFVVTRRDALDGVGGFEAIRDEIAEDMAMGMRMKEYGYRVVFLDAKEVASCRMYTGFRDAFDGLKRTIYSAVGGRPSAVVAISAIVLGLIVMPVVLALVSAARFESPALPVAVAIALFVAQWAALGWDRNLPLSTVALYPLVFLNLVLILGASMMGTGFGLGVTWKGRTVRVPRCPSDPCDTPVSEQ